MTHYLLQPVSRKYDSLDIKIEVNLTSQKPYRTKWAAYTINAEECKYKVQTPCKTYADDSLE